MGQLIKDGSVVNIDGPIVDIKFNGYLPQVNEVLTKEGNKYVGLVVTSQIGESVCRCISIYGTLEENKITLDSKFRTYGELLK